MTHLPINRRTLSAAPAFRICIQRRNCSFIMMATELLHVLLRWLQRLVADDPSLPVSLSSSFQMHCFTDVCLPLSLSVSLILSLSLSVWFVASAFTSWHYWKVRQLSSSRLVVAVAERQMACFTKENR